ncbi:hypothetical protein [Paenibacillus durus]|uniref:hypothetical protein n=1 Tax=Paenibacillus durus TaxID=44251 RepID=UPI000A64BC5B|nr:hypothetical protein [Paenibacillus durus]
MGKKTKLELTEEEQEELAFVLRLYEEQGLNEQSSRPCSLSMPNFLLLPFMEFSRAHWSSRSNREAPEHPASVADRTYGHIPG